MTGIEAFLEILAGAGITTIFGNPGTTELPLNDALVKDERFRYLFALQEVPLTAMADGYAMASGQVGVVCVHISCGLGNAMGMLYNAHCEGTPLLILAGQQDRRLLMGEPVLFGDTVQVARPWTKWAVEVQRVEDVPAATRRAIQVALTPPTGPVFLSLPVDVQMEQVEGLDLRPAPLPDRRVRPSLEGLRRAADILGQARRPAILAGSRVTEADACEELAELAELLGARVYSEATTAHGRLPLRADHPLYGGPMPLWSPQIQKQLADFDALLVVGMSLLRLYIWHEPAAPLSSSVKIVHLDNHPADVAKTHPLEVGLLGDPKAGLAELAEVIGGRRTSEQRAAAAERLREGAAQREWEQEALRATIAEQSERRPMSSLALMGALARVLPENTAVVEEAITTHHNLFERLGVLKEPRGFFAHRGWALGWGLGCALGVKLAWPERPVLGLLGDGAALYGIQGLWTAAHHQIPVTFVIANNAQYRILKVCADHMPLPRMAAGEYLAMDLVGPEVDFLALARGFGVEAHRVSEPEELSERVRESFARTTPLLLDVPIER